MIDFWLAALAKASRKRQANKPKQQKAPTNAGAKAIQTARSSQKRITTPKPLRWGRGRTTGLQSFLVTQRWRLKEKR